MTESKIVEFQQKGAIMKYGYIRVSSVDQNEARQVDAMRLAGIEKGNLFIDKQSGKDFNRPAWRRLRRRLKCDDVLIIQSIDRLGRNYTEILEEWRNIVQVKNANIKVLDMPLLDTTNNTHGLIGKFVGDIVLQVLSFVAETERQNIRERQRQGIVAAKTRGVKFGRPRIAMTDEIYSCIKRARQGTISVTQAAKECGISEATLRRRIFTTTPRNVV